MDVREKFEKMTAEYGDDNLNERPREHYLEQYQAADPLDMMMRTRIPYDEGTREFHVTMCGRGYYVSYPDFNIRKEDESDTSYHVLLEFPKAQTYVMRYLTESRFAPDHGQTVTFRDIKNGELYFKPFQGRCLMRLKYGFGFKIDKFEKGMQRMGGKKVKYGDAGYEFEFLPGLKMTFILWEGDDEFEPNSQILFSDNFGTVLATEDCVVAGDISITSLKGLAQ